MPRKPKPRKRAHGSIRQRGESCWEIRWREKGRRRTANFPDKETAERVLLRIIGDVAAGRGGLEVPRAPLPTLSKLAEKWFERRAHTHRSWRGEQNLWTKDLKPSFGHLQPNEVDHAGVRRLIETKLAEGLSSTTTGHIVALLSTFFTDLIERGLAQTNPARGLPRATRRLIRDAHDPKQTLFIEKQSDIARVYSALAQPFATMFAVGALTGMRPGEVIGMEWGDVDLDARRILVQRQVRHGKVGPTKSNKPRLVPLIEPLAKILAEWRLATGGAGLVFKPLTPWRQRSRFIKDSSMRDALHDALEACELPKMTWYSCSRHTFGAQHVMGGGSFGVLREILGHSSVAVTERYAHLRSDLFRPEDLLKLSVSMSREGGAVVELAAHRNKPGPRGGIVGAEQVDDSSTDSVSTESR